MIIRSVIISSYCILFAVVFPQTLSAQRARSNPFNRDELVAWCIVPFDSAKRGPEERAHMLRDLGITRLAYDWRKDHIPTFGQELDALNKYKIKLQAFWLSSRPGASRTDVDAVFAFLKKRKVKTQIWYYFNPSQDFYQLSQAEKLDAAAAEVAYIAKRADSLGCTVGLYNHNRWFGDPGNQLAIIEKLKMKNIGMVYNFNHAEEQTETFADFYPRIQPHLIALCLAGLKQGDKHIYPIGEGNREQEMIRIVYESGFKGPIGIINENTHPDAKTGLEMNMAGLKKVLLAIGAQGPASTYP